jgi:serine/threonine protein kinase
MGRMDKARWKIVSPWLDQLLDTDPATRGARLERIRLGDGGLAAELESLLAAATAANRGAFLEGQALNVATEVAAGETVGHYTLASTLGHGGMSSVWLAHPADGRHEGLAVKFLSPEWMTPAGLERFQRERSILARLSHPNIAKLLDAGVAGNGQPYLVLEHVDGVPIDRWCARRAASVDARLRLFIDLLAAVSHAHGRHVLHRDLKPSNILVDSRGQLKLLDFGIACLFGDAGAPAPAYTAYTPDFAAPEQVLQQDATPATDVYALGVLLYLLLSGRHPTAMPAATRAERLRAVVEREPLPVSAAARRRNRPLRGDLDRIVAKALRKTPSERYATPAAMARDLDPNAAPAGCRLR